MHPKHGSKHQVQSERSRHKGVVDWKLMGTLDERTIRGRFCPGGQGNSISPNTVVARRIYYKCGVSRKYRSSSGSHEKVANDGSRLESFQICQKPDTSRPRF